MFGNINVNVNPCGGLSPIYMEFLNGGKITIPAKYGGYVVASGCGAGKTTIIKELIANPVVRMEGVLYSAFTIDECNLMYAHVKSIYEKEGRLDKLADEVILLHSDLKSEGTNNDVWRNNPEKLLTMPIIICTHHKLFNELPELLIRYKGYPRVYQDLSPVEKTKSDMWIGDDGTEVGYMPRQLVLIDGRAQLESYYIHVPKLTLELLGSEMKVTDRDGNTSTILNRPKGFIKMKERHNNLSDDQKFMKVNNRSDEAALEIILGEVYDNYEDLVNRTDDVIRLRHSLYDVYGSSVRIITFEERNDINNPYINKLKWMKLN